MTEEDLVARTAVLWMPFIAHPLEILHGEPVFTELLADRVPIDSQSTIILPVGLETEAQAVTRLGKEYCVRVVASQNRAKRWISAIAVQFRAEATQLYTPAGRGIWMPFENSPLKILRDNAVFSDFLGQGIAELIQTPVVPPVLEKCIAEMMAGFRKVDPDGGFLERRDTGGGSLQARDGYPVRGIFVA
jgi:hypothetical protein